MDLSAATLVELLARVDAPEARHGAMTTLRADDGQAAFRVAEAVEMRGEEVPIALEARLDAAATTRIGIEALLDLRSLQARLPELTAGEVLVDNCGGRMTLDSFAAEAQRTTVIATGQLGVKSFDCQRTGTASWERGTLQSEEEIGVRADLSAELVEGCVVFRLVDLRRDPPGAFARIETGSGRMEAARALLLEAIGLILEDKPPCPDLPPELSILDPSFDRGAPLEIGAGGVGIALEGSIDVSPRTIVELLRLLQARGALPPGP